MNDISVKTEESLKDQPVVEETLTADQSGENEVDPLALDDGAAESASDPLTEETPVETSPVVENAGICDENAKEVSLEEKNESDETLTQSVEKVQEEPPKDKEDITEAPGAIEADVTKAEKSEPVESEPQPAIDPEPEHVAAKPIEEALQVPEVVPEEKEIPIKPLSPLPPAKEPSPPKEVITNPKESSAPKEVNTDVEMIEVPQPQKPAGSGLKVKDIREVKSTPPPVNGDVAKEDQSTKRRASADVETESPLKRLCQEVEKTFPQHDTMINDYIQTATKNNIDEIQRHTEQLLSEIQTLRELAQKKEHEWNNILHLKKVKEEILLRLLRRKQVLSFEKAVEVNGSDRIEQFDYLNQPKNLAIDKSDEISGLAIKQPGSALNPMMQQAAVMPVTSHFNPMAGLPPPYDKAAHMQQMPKPVYPQAMMMPGPMPGSMPGFPRDMNGQLPGSFGLPMGRQGPTKDVKSIIADYRTRNPDITPRRGRRMKSILNPNMMNPPRPIAPKMDNLNSLNNMLFNNMDMNQKAMLERLQQIQAGGLLNGVSFKDVLVQYANMQQGPGMMPTRPMEMNRPEHHVRPEGRRRQERNHEEPHASTAKQAERIASSSPRLPPPPPYPEISLLPVTTSQETTTTSQQNSLLHGILTKQASPASQSYSPTLAKLLTSPERKQSAPTLPTFGQAKNCGEITITPVQPTPPPEPQPEKPEEVVQLDDEESAASSPSGVGSPSGSGSGRLVIDEGGAGAAPDGDDGAAPLCQGCRRRDAQFVCAGCANQWYCSRECQVAAWDEHSEMCSG